MPRSFPRRSRCHRTAFAVCALAFSVARTAFGASAERDSTKLREPIAIARLGEATLVELRIGHAVSGTTLAYESPSGRLMLRLGDVLDLAEVKHRDASAGRINGQIGQDDGFEIDPLHSTIRHGKQTWKVGDDELVTTTEGVVASIATIEHVLATEILYDRSSAVVDVRNAERLPVVRRVARLAARAKIHHSSHTSLDATSLPMDWLHAASPKVTPSLLLDYDANITRQSFAPAGLTPRSEWTATGGVNAATTVADGQLRGRVGFIGSGVSLSGLTWQRLWPEGASLTKLELGEVSSRGAENRVVEGIGFSNAVTHAPVVTEMVPVTGSLPAGWDMEAWSSGRLVDATDGNGGRFDLRIPLSAGVSSVDFVAIDPSGEEHAFQRSFSPTPWFVTPGSVEYSVIAGACGRGALATTLAVRTPNGVRSQSCDFGGAADLRYGLRQGWVARGGFDGAHYDNVARSVISTPYLGLAGLPTRQLSIEALFAPYRAAGGAALTSFSARFEPMSAITLSSAYQNSDLVTLRSNDYEALLGDESGLLAATSLERASHRSTLLQISPRRWNNRFAIEASENSQWWNGTVHAGYRAGVAMHRDAFDVRPYVRTEWAHAGDDTNGGTALGIESTMMASGRLGQLLGSTWTRAVVERGNALVPQTELTIGHSSSRWRFDMGLRELNGHGWTWTISAAPLLSKLQLNTVAAASPSGATAASQLVRGSAMIDLATRSATASSEPSSQRGGISGTAYLDRNANGVRDANEPGVAGATIRVGNRLVHSDSVGHYEAWSLAALSEVDITVDTVSLKSPWWIPAAAGVRARVPGNGIGRVDIPIVLGGILQGRILMSDSTALVGDAPLVSIADVKTGSRISVTPFSDGTFYHDGLRPGRYVVTLEISGAEHAGLVAVPREIVVQGDPAAEQPSVLSVELLIRRQGSAPVSRP